MSNARLWRLGHWASSNRHDERRGALRIERRGRTALLFLDNASKGNAISHKMLLELGKATIEIESDRALRAVVLTGAGTRSFCTGADISAWSGLDAVDFARH